MHDAPRTLTPCSCGGTFFRVDTTVPVAFYISDMELSMDLNHVYRSDLTSLVIECQDCGASMDLAGSATRTATRSTPTRSRLWTPRCVSCSSTCDTPTP